jgi:hypothetical protein
MASYRRSVEEEAEQLHHDDRVRLLKVQIGEDKWTAARTQEPLTIRLVVETDAATHANTYLGISQGTSHPVFVVMDQRKLAAGQTELVCSIPRLPLPRGHFFVWIGMANQDEELIGWRPVGNFDVVGPKLVKPPRAVVRPTPVHTEAQWDASRV